MFLGKVVGSVWATKKTQNLEGLRFLIVHPYDLNKEPNTNVVVVADRLGAGIGEIVICAYGKAARSAMGDQELSIEAAVVAIVDEVDIDAAACQSEGVIKAARSLKPNL
ncbi:MAG: EutN/CcmL family microcompartment protein [Acidobacteriota bacterium]